MNTPDYEYKTRLLQDFAPETVIDGSKKIKAITVDRDLIFLIGSDDVFRVVFQDDSSGSGWKTQDISLSGELVTTFDVYTDTESKIVVIGYASLVDGNSNVRISPSYYDLDQAPLIESLDLSEFRLIQLPNNQSVENLIISPEESYLTASVVNSDALYYAIPDNKELTPYSLPDNADSIDSMSFGHWMYDPGLFLLYKVDDIQELIFKSFPDKTYGQSNTTEFSIGDQEVLSIATFYSNGNSILVCSGVSIKIYENTIDPTIEYMHPDGYNISSFDFIKSENNIALLYSCELFNGNHQMYEVSTLDNGKSWSEPSLLGTDVASFSMTGTVENLSLYCVGTNLTTLQRINRNQFWSVSA
jgi:hypothetical protein